MDSDLYNDDPALTDLNLHRANSTLSRVVHAVGALHEVVDDAITKARYNLEPPSDASSVLKWGELRSRTLLHYLLEAVTLAGEDPTSPLHGLVRSNGPSSRRLEFHRWPATGTQLQFKSVDIHGAPHADDEANCSEDKRAFHSQAPLFEDEQLETLIIGLHTEKRTSDPFLQLGSLFVAKPKAIGTMGWTVEILPPPAALLADAVAASAAAGPGSMQVDLNRFFRVAS